MSYMFNSCESLTSLDLSGFDTSNVTDMTYMFSRCSSLTGLNLSGLNTSKAANMFGLFEGCSSLESLDLSSFDTSKVGEKVWVKGVHKDVDGIDAMFDGCDSLASLTLGEGTTRLIMPSASVNGHEDWYSQGARAWLTAAVIDEGRLGIADTYTKWETAASAPTETVMYRLYNPNSGEHLYTADANEKDVLSGMGWRYEGEGWKAPEKSETPVYRLYNPYSGDHHYTLDANEYDTLGSIGWSQEGVAWYGM